MVLIPASAPPHRRNLVAGTKYLEVVGDLTITHDSSERKAVIAFKEGSSWGGQSTRNKIDGKVYDEQGNVQVELVGRWDEHVDKKEGGSHFARLWQINDPPPSEFGVWSLSRRALLTLTLVRQTLNATTASPSFPQS